MADNNTIENTAENAVVCVHKMVLGYDLSFENDGVYLVWHLGAEANAELLIYDLKRRGLRNLQRTAAIEEGLREGQYKVLVAPVQDVPVCSEALLLKCTKDEMMASITFLPASDEERMSFEEMMAKINGTIKHGLDDEAIRAAYIDHRYGIEYMIAYGTAPVNGIDGKLVMHFRTMVSNTPMMMENDRVNYRQLDTYEPVEEGQLLVTRIPPTDGTPGMSVTGRELNPRTGRNVMLPRGDNVTSNEDSTELRAAKSGRVDYIGTKVVVSTCFTVSGDVDMSVGNINFQGDIVISGNVNSGMTIEAERDIEIGGIVEGATIIAGRNIVLKKGVLGADKAKLYAEGDITAQFIERSFVRAKGNITANTIVHSRIEVESSLYVLGTRGTLLGGTCCACGDIAVLRAGTQAHVPTMIEVGVLPEQRERLIFLKSEIKKQENDLARIDLYYADTTQMPDPNEDKAHFDIRMKVFRTRLKLKQSIGALKTEAAAIEEKIENAFDGKLHICDVVAPGVKIVIGSAQFAVNEPIQYATFKRKDDSVVFGPCEYLKDYAR